MRVLVTGGTGLLGWWVVKRGVEKGYRVYATVHEKTPREDLGVSWVRLDLEDPGRLGEVVSETRPDVIIHTAAYTDVDGCEVNRERAYRVNYIATRELARKASRTGSYLVYISTDYVFDGSRGMYREEDVPAPLNFYGLTKLLGEVAVESSGIERHLVVRVSGLFGHSPYGKKNFGYIALERLSRGETVSAFEDQYLSPTYVPHLSERIFGALERGITGVLHIAGERVSRYEFALILAEALGVERGLVRPVSMSTANLVARRPRDSSLDTSRAASVGLGMGSLREAVRDFIEMFRRLREGG